MIKSSGFFEIYKLLLFEYGHQGWWPVISCAGKEGFDNEGYHPGLFLNLKAGEKYEIIIGAILTQNTTWKNAKKALQNLINNGVMNPYSIIELKEEKLMELIISSGYYNQKAKKIKIITDYLIRNSYLEAAEPPTQKELLSLWGIGPETADSILLYAFNHPCFVIDAYTIRIFRRLGITEHKISYTKMQNLFYENLRLEINLFQEYHALIVRHAKQYCRKTPLCKGCSLIHLCSRQDL